MDKNLSKVTTANVVTILRENTNSGIPRLDRIKTSNPELYLRLEGKQIKEIAEELIAWNDEITKNYGITKIISARDEVKKYVSLIDLIANNPERIEIIIPSIKEFKYKNFAKLVSILFDSADSKLIKRINNLIFLCLSYTKNSNNKNKKHLLEYILQEVYYQKAFFLIFSKNIKTFGEEYLPLALLLYDISGEEEKQINILSKLKRYGLKV